MCSGSLSEAALRFAESLDTEDIGVVAECLYRYNSLGVDASWEHRFRDLEAVRHELTRGFDEALQAQLSEHWFEVQPTEIPGWLIWQRRLGGAECGGSGRKLKLYVSPAPESLAPAFRALVEVLSGVGSQSFKVGSTAANLLRPDKMVAYFSDLAELSKAAHELPRRLEGVPAQGVPFTSEITPDGLLSWAMDPSPGGALSNRGPMSWRGWICAQLAVALVEARMDPDNDLPAWQLALDRLSLQGIDVQRWLPRSTTWSGEGR